MQEQVKLDVMALIDKCHLEDKERLQLLTDISNYIQDIDEKWSERFNDEYVERSITTLHCKPCANFQTIEFDYQVDDDNWAEDIEKCMTLFMEIQTRLNKIGSEQVTTKVVKKVEPEELATEKQKATLARFHIPFTDHTTKKEAWNLLNQSVCKGK